MPPFRRVSSAVGLAFASGALAAHVAFMVTAIELRGFSTNFPAMLQWARPGLWLSLAAVALAFTGRGKSRPLAIVTSALILVLWVAPIWAM